MAPVVPVFQFLTRENRKFSFIQDMAAYSDEAGH